MELKKLEETLKYIRHACMLGNINILPDADALKTEYEQLIWDQDKELKKLEETLKLMKKYKVQEISYGEMTIKLSDDWESEMSEETQKALKEIEKTNGTTDEEILYNPYAGLEVSSE